MPTWRTLFFAALGLTTVGFGDAAAQGLPTTRPDDIGLSAEALDRIAPALQAYVDSGKLAGIVGVVARRGKVGYARAVGWMDAERRVPMRTDGVFRIYSMTKPIIAAGILKLVEQGKARLDDPVANFVPAFAEVKVYAGGAAAAPQVKAPDGPITLTHLLTHTAGLTYGYFGQTPVDSMYRRANLMPATRTTAQFADSLARLPLLFSPGSAWTYSVSIDLLGRVIEVASGQPLDRFLHAEIFTPLGMRETGFRVRPEMEGRIPVLYTRGPDGRLRPNPQLLADGYQPTSQFLSGGGGLLSTPADYLRFAQMLLNGGELDGRRVLTRESVAQMTRNHLAPTLTPIAGPIVGHSGYGHGLGGIVLVDSTRSGLPGSPGIYRWWGYAGTFFWIDPKTDLIGMVWTQLVPGRTYPLEQDFQRLVYSAITR
ncbi:MAG: serine hydrolase domain-containing protein [Gemmatimonadales bacterium]